MTGDRRRVDHPTWTVFDTLVVADRFITVDDGLPRAKWLAVQGDRIAAIGTHPEDMPRARRTFVLDECVVVPGFHDAHNHSVHFGASLTAVDLRYPAVKTVDEAYAAVAAAAARWPAGSWIFAENYDQNKIGGHLDARGLDTAAPHHFVRVGHTSRHMCVVNSRVLRALHIDRAGPTTGGLIVGDGSGMPTGLLQESAMELVRPLTWPTPMERIVEDISAAHARYVREGLTAVQEAGVGSGLTGTSPGEIGAFQLARGRGALRVRTTLMPLAADAHRVETATGEDVYGFDLPVVSGFGDLMLRIGPLKVFSDGSLLGRSAAMNEAYADDPGNSGYLTMDEADIEQTLRAAHRSGWQVATHAIGDRAVDAVVAAYEKVLAERPRPDHRHRIEHAGVVTRETLNRIVRLRLIPSPQGRFIGEIGDGMARALGQERVGGCYRARSYVDAGVELPASSDRPVVDGAPLNGIHDLVNRRTDRGASFGPGEALTVEQALRAYTYGSAHATFLEKDMSSLVPGKLADFTVLSADPTAVPPENIHDVEVLATVIGGEVAFDRDARLTGGKGPR